MRIARIRLGSPAPLLRLGRAGIAGLIVAALGAFPVVTPPAPPAPGVDAAAVFARFNAWCGAADRAHQDAPDPAPPHSSFACLLHCLRNAPPELRLALVSPRDAVPLPPHAGFDAAGAAPPRLVLAHRLTAPAGARAPPAA